MKSMHFILPIVIAGVAASAAAAETKKPSAELKKPVTQWTCADFLAIEDQFQPNAVYWASAYAKGGKPEASEIDIAGTETVTPMVIDECEKEPKASFWHKLKAAWHKVEAGAKTETKKIEKKM